MNFKEWWKKDGNNVKSDGGLRNFSECGWNACKEEITRIIFLNSHQNGEFRCDIRKVLEEIEKL